MNIVFIGTTRFGLRCLQALARVPQCRVVGAVAAAATFPISYRPQGVRNVLHADVAAYCQEAGLPCLRLAGGMKEKGLLEHVAQWRPDAFVVAGWYHMLPRSWRELAPAYGLHASLLPDYSGGAPLVWAVINGERKTGITLFQLGEGVDDGPILGQSETPILSEDTIATLYDRIEELGVGLLERHLPRLAAGRARLQAQDERRRRIFPQRGPEDGEIDWSRPARTLHDFIRAQTRPYPGAFTRLQDSKLTIWTSRVADHGPGAMEPGQFACRHGHLFAGAGCGGAIELVSFDLDGEEIGAEELCERFGADAGTAETQ